MTQTSKADRALARATRLRNEARNCLSIATSVRDTQFAAQLIDEAVQLARRAREIAA